MAAPLLTPLAASLPDIVPFVGPEALERQRHIRFRARVGANESVFGPSPKVIAAIAQSAGESWKYCDPENFELRAALAEHYGIGIDHIGVGEGIDGIESLVVRLFIEPGRSVLTSLGAYPTLNYHVAGFGGRLLTVPYRDDREDIFALSEMAQREKPAIVYLVNPDNPMGSWWSAAEVERFIDAVPPETLVLLDEAYIETAPEGTAPPITLMRSNLLRLRTFSKAYGLAGLRVGYAIGPAELIRAFNKVRNHFGVNRIGQVAALAALADQEFLRGAVAKIIAARAEIARIAEAVGLRTLPSATNFVAIECGRDGVFAQAVLDGLIARGVFVRKPVAPGLDRCIRISAGQPEELAVVEEALRAVLGELR